MNTQNKTGRNTLSLMVSSALVTGFGLGCSSLAWSQVALEEIIVTAQKRAQSVQDVPIAITALTQEALVVNRVVSVSDLSGLAPNVSVRPASGGTNIPAFTIRGRTSYGVVAGADKQVSIYLDGVYIGSPRGSMFTLPDIASLEVLRGPQGTLFGRNATAGAVNITTRDPSGEFGFQQDAGFGSNNHFRTRTTIESPAVGDFSGYLSYTQEERDGDVKNLGGGTVWNMQGFGMGSHAAPERMRDTDLDSIFVAGAWEPRDDFKATYKYDRSTDEGSPDANVLVSVYPPGSGPFAPVLETLLATNPALAASATYPSIARPDSTYNAYTAFREQTAEGHSLTLNWEINDQFTFKNITAYRETDVWMPTDISGISIGPVGQATADTYNTKLVYPPLQKTIDSGALAGFGIPPGTPASIVAPLLGVNTAAGTDAFCAVCSNSWNEGDQFSNEVQLNYDSDFMTVTLGALYYEQDEVAGSPPGGPGTLSFTFYDASTNGYVVPAGPESVYTVDAKSYAGYVQSEFHVTPDLDLVAGYRLTRDERDTSVKLGTAPNYTGNSAAYDDTKGSYLLGANYSLADNMLLYAKFSTAFVTGGNIAGLAFDPEEAESFEVGMKGDFLDDRLRANVSLYDVTYKDPQTAQSGRNIAGFSSFGVLIVPLGGDIESQGAEVELTALPMDGLTLNAALGYSDDEITEYSQLIGNSVGGNIYPNSDYLPTLSPEWNGSVSANYETAPLFDNAFLAFNVSGIWRDTMRLEANPGRAAAVPQFGVLEHTPASWVWNARAALTGLKVGEFEGEVAFWGRNLTDNDDPTTMLNFGAAVSANYLEERTFGVDFSLKY